MLLGCLNLRFNIYITNLFLLLHYFLVKVVGFTPRSQTKTSALRQSLSLEAIHGWKDIWYLSLFKHPMPWVIICWNLQGQWIQNTHLRFMDQNLCQSHRGDTFEGTLPAPIFHIFHLCFASNTLPPVVKILVGLVGQASIPPSHPLHPFPFRPRVNSGLPPNHHPALEWRTRKVATLSNTRGRCSEEKWYNRSNSTILQSSTIWQSSWVSQRGWRCLWKLRPSMKIWSLPQPPKRCMPFERSPFRLCLYQKRPLIALQVGPQEREMQPKTVQNVQMQKCKPVWNGKETYMQRFVCILCHSPGIYTAILIQDSKYLHAKNLALLFGLQHGKGRQGGRLPPPDTRQVLVCRYARCVSFEKFEGTQKDG